MANERLAALLFRLARDELPQGVIEEHVRVVEQAHSDPDAPVRYEHDGRHLGAWARETAERLTSNRSSCPRCGNPYTFGGHGPGFCTDRRTDPDHGFPPPPPMAHPTNPSPFEERPLRRDEPEPYRPL